MFLERRSVESTDNWVLPSKSPVCRIPLTPAMPAAEAPGDNRVSKVVHAIRRFPSGERFLMNKTRTHESTTRHSTQTCVVGRHVKPKLQSGGDAAVAKFSIVPVLQQSQLRRGRFVLFEIWK
jgi:hypothetical protein